MRAGIRFIVAGALMTLVIFGGVAAASAGPPIQPNQHFVGLVKGTHVNAVIYTVCPGPIWVGRTGPVVGSQYLSVAKLASGGGFTGLFSRVYAWVVQDSSPFGPQQVKFRTYGTNQPIPTAVRVPCGGSGQVEFSSCPHLAPCAFGWIPDFVSVKFVNIAA